MDIESLVGKTIATIEGLQADSERVRITFTDGTTYVQHHEQDCCESVLVSQVDGNPSIHIGEKLMSIKETTLSNSNEVDESGTATFYKVVTTRGWLDWRWQGESNGYYSESVDYSITNEKDRE